MVKGIYKDFRVICHFVLCIAFTGCIPEGIELPNIYSVTTADVTNITVDGATLNGSLGIMDTEKAVAFGVEYGTKSTSLSTNLTVDEITSAGDFSVNLTGLVANTTYYYRAYAVDAKQYRYGDVRTFTTCLSIATGDATNVTYSTATLGGTVNSGGHSVTCGIIYGTSSTLSSSKGTKKPTTSSGSYSVTISGLKAKTTYYYRAYAIVDGEYEYGEVRSFTTEADTSITVGEAVDLGLSVKWASWNVGATAPEEYGGYYAWGETEEKTEYSWSTYKWCNGSEYSLTKYCTDNYYGTLDYKSTLEPEDDVAHVKWGDSWRMPTFDEIMELLDECSWQWTAVNGVNGQKVTGPNGNSIFLPAAGYYASTMIYERGSEGLYNSSMLAENSFLCYSCRGLVFDESRWYWYGHSGYQLGRHIGFSVRPVYGAPKSKASVTTGDATNITDGGATLGGTISNSDKSLTCGIIYGTSSTLSSTSGTLLSTTSSSEFSVRVTGLSASTTYYYCAYVVVDGEYKYGDVRSFTTEAISITAGDAIDLGLSVKWASWNVGADSPEEYGGYYAWGETEEKSNYDWDTYKWCNGSYDTQTKYCTNSSDGTVDNKTTLDLEDDVAHIQWGDNWRMPTKVEQDELRTECSWSWTSVNGVNGYQVTGPNGNSIFLPAAGYRIGEDVNNRGTNGSYWSATLNSYYNDYVYYFFFRGGYYEGGSYCRSYGHTVRPVYGAPKSKASVTTGDATNITDGGATLGGTISNSDKSLTCGIIYGTSSTLSSTSGTMLSTTSSGEFSVSVTGLSASTTYYYCAYVVVGDKYKYGDVRSFTTEAISITAGDAIDLGLSVKWASCNVGAESPEEYGGYYAWGETTTKSSYSSDNSVTYGLSISELKSRGIIDAAGNLTAAYDAATANRGDKWRMPTLDEMMELINNRKCKWEWTKMNGVNGYKVTGPNGNSIFLPAAGYRSGTEVGGRGTNGDYWSGTLCESLSYHAFYLHFLRYDNFLSYDLGCYENSYYCGFPVRPVTDGKRHNSDVDLDGYPEDENWDARKRR